MINLFVFLVISNLSSNELELSSQTIIQTTPIIILNEIDEIKYTINNSTITDENYKIINEILETTKNKINYILKNDFNRKEENPINAIKKVRKGLLEYFIKTNRYPKSVDELIPYFIDFIPEIKVHNDYNSTIKYIYDRRFDKDYKKAVDGTTEYLYFSDPQSIYYGFIIINSTDIYNEVKYYEY